MALLPVLALQAVQHSAAAEHETECAKNEVQDGVPSDPDWTHFTAGVDTAGDTWAPCA